MIGHEEAEAVNARVTAELAKKAEARRTLSRDFGEIEAELARVDQLLVSLTVALDEADGEVLRDLAKLTSGVFMIRGIIGREREGQTDA